MEALLELIRKQNKNKMGSYPKKIIISRIPCYMKLVIKKAAHTRALQTHLQIKVLKAGSDRMRQKKDC